MAEHETSTARKIVREENVKKFVTPEQKRQRKIVLIVVVLLLGIAAAGYFFLVPKEQSYAVSAWESARVERGDLPRIKQASGTVTVPDQIIISAPQEGYASELFAEEGETVTNGQLLAVMEVPDLEEQLADLLLDIEDKEKLLRKTEVQNKIDHDRKSREIARMKKTARDESAEREKLERLVAINASRQSELEAQEDKIVDLNDEIEEAEVRLEEDAVLRELEIEMVSLNIRQIETNIQQLEDKIAKAEIRSPMTGEVLERDDSLAVPGSLIEKNRQLFTIADTDSAVIELEVDENYSGNLEKGQTVEMDVSGTLLSGTITGIGRVATVTSDGVGATVTVKVKPENVTRALVPGSSVTGKFQIGVLEDILMLPRGPYLSTGSRRYLYKVDGNVARKTSVTFGESENNYIEIIDGAVEGDEIIISGYQNFIEHETVTLHGGN